MTFFGNPCSEKTLSWYKVAIPLDVIIEFVGRKNNFFVNQSTTTKMVSNPFDSGNGPIMSIEIICQGPSGISLGWRGAAFACQSGFTV